MILYHWTLRTNLRSVRRYGLSPLWSQGKVKTVWACTAGHLGWALAHVAARHGVSPDEMVLLTIRPLRRKLLKTRWVGVYVCHTGYPPERIVSVRHGILGGPKPLTATGGLT